MIIHTNRFDQCKFANATSNEQGRNGESTKVIFKYKTQMFSIYSVGQQIMFL